MNKNTEEQNSLRKCYKTTEWSANSIICLKCNLKEECGKAKSGRRSKVYVAI